MAHRRNRVCRPEGKDSGHRLTYSSVNTELVLFCFGFDNLSIVTSRVTTES